MKIAGIDEAGRGCVIGHMVMASVALPQKREGELETLGVGDSKRFSPAKRKRIYQTLLDLPGVEIYSLGFSPAEIDQTSLTDLTKRGIIELVGRSGPGKVFLDVPAPPSGVENYLNSLREALGTTLQVEGSNKGEDRYLVVAAASIIAKVRRDERLEELKKEAGDFGSGYPSDPKTRKFLQKILDSQEPLPPFVRTKWKTLHNLRQIGPV